MSEDSCYHFSPPPYGFGGRDQSILEMETLLRQHNILLLWGIGGTGKTTLLHYLREEWQTNQFAMDIFYFGYDQQTWTLAQIVGAIAKQLYTPLELTSFQALPPNTQLQKLTHKLRAGPYVLMLDNLEVVTGQDFAIQNTLLPADKANLQSFLCQLIDGNTKVILSARGQEDWLDGVVRGNQYELKGLDEEKRSLLATQILEQHVGDRAQIAALQQEQHFLWLMKVLAGYPLAMEVILANLEHQTPTEILAGLDAADVDLDLAWADKTRSILRCVEYAYSLLSPAAQHLLVGLAPFHGFIFLKALPQYVAELEKLEALASYNFTQLGQAVQDALNWGLLSPMGGEDGSPFLVMQAVFPYILRTKLAQIDAAAQAALASGFKQHCRRLAESYEQLLESEDTEQQKLGRFLCKLEYANLSDALQDCLERHETIEIFFCLAKYLRQIQDHPRELELVRFVCQRLEQYPDPLRVGKIVEQYDRAFELLARRTMQLQQPESTPTRPQGGLETYLQLKRVELRGKRRSSPSIYQWLGEVAQEFQGYD